MWCIQAITEEYRTGMYRLLKLYQQGYNPKEPLVCMDEKSKQLLKDSRQPIKAKPGKPEKYDYEYKRKGTCNIIFSLMTSVTIWLSRIKLESIPNSV